ncbi:MAG: ABC transporter permease [Deltaproteobacteria bacterium]|nr:ABC transporter permease [Deltaproteobacteria bacterium]
MMAQTFFNIEKAEGEEPVVHLYGRLDRDVVGPLWTTMVRSLEEERPRQIVFDLEEVAGIDTAGAALLQRMETFCANRGIAFFLKNVPYAVDEYFQYIREHSSETLYGQPGPSPDFISRLGQWSVDKISAMGAFVEFIGEVTWSSISLFGRSARSRLYELWYHLETVGAQAMSLVVALSGLMGMVIAFQSASSMKDFGISIFLADAVVIGVTREMAPLMVGVVLAGRSGAAFAAEIGTMKINEELDALAVMDFDLTTFLVLPRVLALALAGPLLTMLANAAGIFGGFLTAVLFLNLPAFGFIKEVKFALTPVQLYTGMIKGFSFGLLIGLIGCFCGLRTGVAPENVAKQTTTSVVSGIFIIILADAFFSGIFNVYGW